MLMYSDVIELADEAFARNRRVRAHSEHLRAQTTALLFTYRLHRFPKMRGASDTGGEDCVRRLLRDFCAVIEPPKSFVGFSRGAACQACGNAIKAGEREYDVVAGTSELRLDEPCYKFFLEESLASDRRVS